MSRQPTDSQPTDARPNAARPNGAVWIGTSWKMNKTIGEALEYVSGLAASALPAGVQPFVLPPHTALAAVRDRLAAAPAPGPSPILLGAQNAHWAPEGAGTGEISMRMAADAGALLVEIGHSERRTHFGETDETVALKVRAALDHALIPLVCVGESRSVRDSGQAADFVAAQVRAATSRLSQAEIPDVLLAYEPVWAIGSAGRPASPAEVSSVMAAIAAEVATLSATGRCRALLYGGGVDQANAADLLAVPHTDGLFVGRAGWQVAGLIELIEIGAVHAAGARR